MNSKPYHHGIINEIREASKALGTFSIRELARSEVIRSFIRPRKVQDIVYQLRQDGEIERVSEGVYRYIGGRAGRIQEVSQRISRAIHIKGSFSAADIIRLTGADKSYAYRIIRRLVKSQDLERIGSRENLIGREEALFRVRYSDDFYKKYITTQTAGGGSE